MRPACGPPRSRATAVPAELICRDRRPIGGTNCENSVASLAANKSANQGFFKSPPSTNVGISTIWNGSVDWTEPRRSGLARVIPAVLSSRVVRRLGRPVFGKMVCIVSTIR